MVGFALETGDAVLSFILHNVIVLAVPLAGCWIAVDAGYASCPSAGFVIFVCWVGPIAFIKFIIMLVVVGRCRRTLG